MTVHEKTCDFIWMWISTFLWHDMFWGWLRWISFSLQCVFSRKPVSTDEIYKTANIHQKQMVDRQDKISSPKDTHESHTEHENSFPHGGMYFLVFYQNNPVLSTACIIKGLKAADMHLEHHKNSLLLHFNFNHNRSGTEMQGNRELKMFNFIKGLKMLFQGIFFK